MGYASILLLLGENREKILELQSVAGKNLQTNNLISVFSPSAILIIGS